MKVTKMRSLSQYPRKYEIW